MVLIGMAIGAGIGAGIGFGSAAYADYKEDGKWFNGDWTDYVGRTLGGAVAGAGVGLAGFLGAAAGTATIAGTSATLLGMNITLGSALGIGTTASFITGIGSYAIHAGISSSEQFDVGRMFAEGAFNAVSGALSVVGGYIIGYGGLRGDLISNLFKWKGDGAVRMILQGVFVGPWKITLSNLKNEAFNS